MTVHEFKTRIISAAPVGAVFSNPGGGTSEVVSIDGEKLVYLRRKSRINIRFSDLFSAYQKFKGMKVTTNDLKEFSPDVFDTIARPAGHDCNCTIMFLLLNQAGLAGDIEGKGVRGNPFACRFF
mgnify:CR=1 FL=1